jgi:hypothetical protein
VGSDPTAQINSDRYAHCPRCGYPHQYVKDDSIGGYGTREMNTLSAYMCSLQNELPGQLPEAKKMLGLHPAGSPNFWAKTTAPGNRGIPGWSCPNYEAHILTNAHDAKPRHYPTNWGGCKSCTGWLRAENCKCAATSSGRGAQTKHTCVLRQCTELSTHLFVPAKDDAAVGIVGAALVSVTDVRAPEDAKRRVPFGLQWVFHLPEQGVPLLDNWRDHGGVVQWYCPSARDPRDPRW